MKTFRNKLKAITGQSKIEEYRTRYQLALAGVESITANNEKPCYSLYVALSHLAEIPELGVTLGLYDNLLYSIDQKIDYDILQMAKGKVRELEELLRTMEVAHFEQRQVFADIKVGEEV